MNRAFYTAYLSDFLKASANDIIGETVQKHAQDLVIQQTNAWKTQIEILQKQLASYTSSSSHIFFEFLIPRMGRRADVVLVLEGMIFVIEFKNGSDIFNSADIQQAHGYAIDLKNFHQGSHNKHLIPILIATHSDTQNTSLNFAEDNVASPVLLNMHGLHDFIKSTLLQYKQNDFDPIKWSETGYKPTPTIVEAAQALYDNHDVKEISRSDAGAINIASTSKKLLEIINYSRTHLKKSICFVTGVPGAGKTLVGLDIATKHSNPKDEEYAVFLSGNGPLVEVLREALARSQSQNTDGMTKKAAEREASQFIQNIHHFRDSALQDSSAPIEKVVIFDEAQRAWDRHQTSKFMRSKKGQPDFDQSEPDFLLEVMDRHDDWCVVIALIGGGQEINTGEAGIEEWLSAVSEKFKHWQCYYSAELNSKEYVTNDINFSKFPAPYKSELGLHLATSMRSFRSENLSKMIHYLIDGNFRQSHAIYDSLKNDYPIAITRDLETAKFWIKKQARANESKGLVASSGAIRLKPEGIFVKNRFHPKEWFLNDDSDIRSCHYLEDVATEFDIQGLELDWCIVGWDADYRMVNGQFEHWKFKGTKWQRRNKTEDQQYLENAYRVLLTRARQGFVIFIPEGDSQDITRPPSFYDETYQFLKDCGLKDITE